VAKRGLLENCNLRSFERLVVSQSCKPHVSPIVMPTVRTVALMLQYCVSLCVLCNVCFVARWYVLEQQLLLTTYRKSHTRNRFVPKCVTFV